MFRKIKVLFLILFFILIVTGIVKDKVFDTPQACLNKLKQLPAAININDNIFESRKTFIYKMYFWSMIPMGELRYSTKRSDLDVVFSLEALTDGSFIERFITAQARVESYFLKNDLLPYKYTERTQVNGKVKQKIVLYDRINLLSIQDDKKIKISPDTYDPVGAFVHMLTLSLKPGEDRNIPFLSGHDIYIFKARLLNNDRGIDEVDIDMRRKNLTSSHGGRLHVWLTSGNNKIPLLFKSWTPAGYASVVLDRIENVQ